MFHFHEKAILRKISVELNNSGFKPSPASNDWIFQFRLMRASIWALNKWHFAADPAFINPFATLDIQSASHTPVMGSATFSPQAVDNEDVLVVTIGQEPSLDSFGAGSPGGDLHVTVLATRGDS